MMPKGKRPSISISGLTYDRFKTKCQAEGRKLSPTVEVLVLEVLDGQASAPVEPPKKEGQLPNVRMTAVFKR